MSSGSYVSTKPRVDRRFFLAFMWGGAAISSLFVFARLAIRLKAFRRLYSDDGLVVLAWISSLGACVLWQMVVDDLYNQYKLSTGQLALTPDVIKGEKNLLRGTLAYLIFFHTCIYSIKGSFLLFFRRLDSKAQGFRKRWWWFVAIITLAGYLSSCGTIQWKCLLSSLDYIFTQCSKEAAIKYEHSTFSYQCAIDVITDTLIISIPIIMLWNVKVALRKKVALIALFSLTVIVIGISITRVSVVPTMSAQADVSWLYFWHNLEVPVTLIVSSLASFRQLFVTQSTSGFRRTENSKVATRFQSLLSNARWPFHFTSRQSVLPSPKVTQRHASTEDDVLPLRSIYVSHNVGVSSVPRRDDASL